MGRLGCADGREWVCGLGMDAARGYSGAYLVWRERRIGLDGEEGLAGFGFVSMRIWSSDINIVTSVFFYFLFTFSGGVVAKDVIEWSRWS